MRAPAALRNVSAAMLCVSVLLLGVACGSDAGRVPDHVTGPITAIGRGAGGTIQRFTVRQGDQLFEVRIDPRRDYGFDLEHLEQHRASDWPVMVQLEQRGGELYAASILDAQSPSPG